MSAHPVFDVEVLASIAARCPEAVARAAVPTDLWLAAQEARLDAEVADRPALWWPPAVEAYDVDPAPLVVSTVAGAAFWSVRDGRPEFGETIAAVRKVVTRSDFPRRAWGATFQWAIDAFDAGAQIANRDLLRVWDRCGTPRWDLRAPASLEVVAPAASEVRAGSIERQLAAIADELGRGPTPSRRTTLVQHVGELSAELGRITTGLAVAA